MASQPRKLGWRHRLVFALTATDAAVIVAALLVAQFVRFRTTALGAATPQSDVAYLSLGATIAVVWMIALSATRSRLIRNIGTGTVEYQRVVNATLITFGTLAVVAFLLQLEIARGYLAVALPLGLTLLLLGRVTWRYLLHRMRRVGRCTTGSIVVGRPDDVVRVVDELRRQYRVGYRAIGATFVGLGANPADAGDRPAHGGLRRARGDVQAHEDARGDRRGRPPGRERHHPAPRLGAGELEHRAHPRVAPHRRRGSAHPPPTHQRPARWCTSTSPSTRGSTTR